MSLRLFVVVPTWDGPSSRVQDHDASAFQGDLFVRELPPGCVVRAAIGWKAGEAFAPIAHSPALCASSGAPSPFVADALVRWTPDGILPVASADRDATAIERALLRLRSNVREVSTAAAMDG